MASLEPTPLPPFLKWAGGKRWFAERYLHMLPASFKRYVEPFLGSGALFFAIRPAAAILSDINGDLIVSYKGVRKAPEVINRLLSEHHAKHCENYYYATRAKKPSDPLERAAWFIYLNRTCWNGLYRVNRRNEFNVPLGTKTQVILPTDDFLNVSKILKKAKILTQDFETTLDAAEDGDFVFVDPPYTVKHNMNGFIKYNDRIFSWDDQIRLRDAVARASARGAMILVTNANHQYIRDIYDGLGYKTVLNRASVLAASSLHRVRTEELTIQTWVK